MKVTLMITKDVIIKESVYKREYYLKKKMVIFQEKYDFIFSDEDLKKMDEVFYKLKDNKLLEKITKKFNKRKL